MRYEVRIKTNGKVLKAFRTIEGAVTYADKHLTLLIVVDTQTGETLHYN